MEVVSEYLPLVKSVVGSVAWNLPRHVAREDLVSAGSEGLVDAARKFDPSKGVTFAAYAAIRIRGAMIDELRHRDHLSRSDRRHRHDYAGPPISLDEPEATEVADCRADTEGDTSTRQQMDRMRAATRLLPLRLQKLLTLYYGDDLTLREIGAALSVTESRACQLHREALAQLRRTLN
jgi:RNA polymerase sigma factor for flagellar operon FliA